MSFVLKMAWRDTRASRRRLMLFSLSIVLGVAALVAVGSLRDNLRRAVEEQTKALLGADLVITSRTALTPEAEQFIHGLGGEQAREIAFNSMLVVPGAGGATRLVQVRALRGGFPFYGEFATTPAAARGEIASGANALIEEGLVVQYGLKPGDTVKLGTGEFRVAGGLLKVPGESAAGITALAPRVFIPLEAVTATGLLKQGSLARYRVYLKFPENTDVEQRVRQLREKFRELRLGFDTVEERRRELGAALTQVNSFLMIAGFASLFLGAIGIATAVHAHVRQKIPTVAVLRCLGASSLQAFAVYLIQGVGLGLAGALAGAVVGVGVQLALPVVLRDVLPFSFEFFVSWPAVGGGVGVGVLISVLFALLPLLEIRRVSPLLALRSAFAETGGGRDWLRVLLLVAIAAVVFAFAILQMGNVRIGAAFAGMLFFGFAVLAGLAKVIAWAARRLNVRRLPFAWRQGVANLHRPNNRTVLLLVSLGMGTFLMMTLYLTRDTLMAQLRVMGGGERPNLMLFDIQDDQVESISRIAAANGAPVRAEAPIVTMRISGLKGRPVAEVLKDPQARVAAWTVRREYRSTYRSALVETESVIAGKFVGEAPAGAESVPVSLEENLARDLGVKLGDAIEFDVQGVPVKTVVGSLRKVEWQRLAPNFFVVFPAGVLEGAPKFHVMALRVTDPAASARVQQAVVREHPNVSAIDLGLIMQTIDSVYAKASFVVEFLALFTVVTGVIVLAGAVLIGRGQRVRESVLLRTLGATKRQVNRIMLAEYLALGTLGAAVGAVLAVGANWGLARFVFKLSWSTPSLAVLVIGWLAVSAVTIVTGLLSSRGICDHPPLEVLRQET
jgi:putative ABC transport system permease protein